MIPPLPDLLSLSPALLQAVVSGGGTTGGAATGGATAATGGAAVLPGTVVTTTTPMMTTAMMSGLLPAVALGIVKAIFLGKECQRFTQLDG